MPEPVFVIRNQHGLYLTRQNEWVDGYDAAPLFKAAFRDIALNTLIELNAKDIELRGTILEVDVNDKGLPQVTPADQAPAAESAAVASPDLIDALSVQEADSAIDAETADAETDSAETDNEEALPSDDDTAEAVDAEADDAPVAEAQLDDAESAEAFTSEKTQEQPSEQTDEEATGH